MRTKESHPMNTETRAKESVAFMGRHDGKLAPMLGDYAVSIIAAAIRQAENDKLEEAAAVLQQKHGLDFAASYVLALRKD